MAQHGLKAQHRCDEMELSHGCEVHARAVQRCQIGRTSYTCPSIRIQTHRLRSHPHTDSTVKSSISVDKPRKHVAVRASPSFPKRQTGDHDIPKRDASVATQCRSATAYVQSKGYDRVRVTPQHHMKIILQHARSVGEPDATIRSTVTCPLVLRAAGHASLRTVNTGTGTVPVPPTSCPRAPLALYSCQEDRRAHTTMTGPQVHNNHTGFPVAGQHFSGTVCQVSTDQKLNQRRLVGTVGT